MPLWGSQLPKMDELKWERERLKWKSHAFLDINITGEACSWGGGGSSWEREGCWRAVRRLELCPLLSRAQWLCRTTDVDNGQNADGLSPPFFSSAASFFFSWTWKEKGDWLYRAIICVREWNEEGRIHQRMRGESTVLATALLDNYGAGPLLLKGKCIHTQYKLNKRRHHWTGNVWKWLP